MTYKSKLDESEHQAHYQNVANKILRDLDTLRSSAGSSLTSSRRWIWELIQNASDVADGNGVKIRVDFQESRSPYVTFSHSGRPFTADNIRYLIEQVSSKDRGKDDDGKRKSRGKFGTGFLTTHLLAELVNVKGVAKEPDLEYVQFDLVLDRRGEEPDEIIKGVENAMKSASDLDALTPIGDYDETAFNTSFTYLLEAEANVKAAQAGIADLNKCLPYSIAFVKDITSVEVLNQRTFSLDKDNIIPSEIMTYFAVEIVERNSEPNHFFVATLNKNFTTIAVPVLIGKEDITIATLEDNVPKLFCDFPLLGTEEFPFPVIINNPNFNPTDPRDGIYLTTPPKHNTKIEENKTYILEAAELYLQLLDYACTDNWKNLHTLANIPTSFSHPDLIDTKWFTDNVINPIRSKLLLAKIVETADGRLESIVKDGAKYIWFPSGVDKEFRQQIWKLANAWFPHALPKESDIELWNKLIWKDCGKLTSSQLTDFVQTLGTVDELQKRLGTKDVFEWLNEFYEVIKGDKGEYDSLINHKAIFPNQNGKFCKKSVLHLDEKISIDSDFKDILALLNFDIRDKLVDDKIDTDFEKEKFWDRAYAVKEINARVREKANNRETAKSFKPAFKELLKWFKNNADRAKSLFPDLYSNKHLLYDDEEILSNIGKAEEWDSLLKELKVSTTAEILNLLQTKQSESRLLPVTESIVVSMGITSLEEWEEALQDKDLAALFSHESVPTTDMFMCAQGHIKTAKANIISHLKTLPNYNLDNLDDTTAKTTLAGISKDGADITIIARPAYNGEVIIYYGSERDILDHEPSELWIDDGSTQRRISLGHILKKAQIVKFPV